ncbi:formin-binding protein 1-like isoform X1 [Dermacentor silvarum]|uniref:formin-binding protein 1-like isoform X1 n=1 Tax=Dermacentor silvarum TaxID=543639 RepID=UPI0018981DA9|nr:formin-binding protein 1-like isoform X1 [Dermacentor silvarum]
MCSSWSAGAAEPARAKCRLVLSYVGTLRRRPRVPSASPRYWAEQHQQQQHDEDVRIYRRPWGTANGHHHHLHCRDQYDKISQHTHQGLQFLENFSQFIKDRSTIETDYAARLRKLAKSYQPKKKDDEDNGYTSSKAFCLVLNEINDIAGQHELIAENLSTSINREVATLIKELKEERKRLLSEGSKLQTALQNSVTSLDKSKKYYEKMFREAEKAQEAFAKADADLQLSRADLEKAKQNSLAKNKACEDSKTDYANQLQKTNLLQRKHYTELMPKVFEQLQSLDERRTASLQNYIKKAAEIHREVIPIIIKCLDGIVVAADSIDPKKDAETVVEKYKSGFVPADDFPFEDLSVTRNCDSSSTTGSTVNSSFRGTGDTVRGTISTGKKKRSGLFGIFSSNKNNIDEFKDDYSNLPPNQRRKKLLQELDKTRTQINTLTQAREGLYKLKGSYEQNAALGDPQTIQGEINDIGAKLEKLQTDLEKYQNYLTEVDSQMATPDTQKRYRNSFSEGSLSRSASESSVSNNHQNNNKGPPTPITAHNNSTACRPESGLGTSHTSIPDDDGDFEENGYEVDSFEAELLPPLGRAVAIYAFDAQSEGSIPMEEGEEFLVVEVDQGDGWTRVRRENLEEGFVPTSYLECTMFNSC